MRNAAHIRPRLTARLAILLLASLALSVVAAPAAATPAPSCDPEGPTITGPTSIYIVDGQPISDHIYATDCEPADWSANGDLPTGVSFDSTARKFVGTPTSTSGSFELIVTDTRGEAFLRGTFEPLDTAVLPSGPDGAAIDLEDLAPGDSFELHGMALDGTQLEVFWDRTSLAKESGRGVFGLELAVPGTATRGPHQIKIVFELSNGQRYTTTRNVTVTDLELSGPAAIYPVVGVNASYAYQGIDASADAEYQLEGELPAGMTFDTATATISGTPKTTTAHPQQVIMYVHDGDRSKGLEIAISVTSAAAITPPPVISPDQFIISLDKLGELYAESGEAEDPADQERLEELLEQQAEEAQNAGTHLLVGLDPGTGEPTILIGTGLETAKEQARRLAEAAERNAAAAAAKEAQALIEEQKLKLEAERLKKLKESAGVTLKEQLQLQLQQLTKQKEAAEAKAEAEEQAATRLALEKAMRALEERGRLLEARAEENPLPSGSTVTVELHSDPVLLGQATVGASGEFLIRTSIPTGTPLGDHHLVVTYTLPDGAVHTQSMAVTVIGSDPAAAGSEVLPVTGADVAPAGYAGTLMLVVGLALMAWVRRTRRTASGSVSSPSALHG